MGKGSKPHRNARRTRARKALGAHLPSSKAGRPRAAGERYASGRLKPAGPNLRVVAERRALLGVADAKGQALKAAENALDLALARGWLSKELRQAAEDYAALHRRSALGLTPIRTSNPEQGPGGSRAPRAADAQALYRLSHIWQALAATPSVRRTLVEVCVLGAWPKWVIDAAKGDARALTSPERRTLQIGLATVNAAMSRPAPAGLMAEGSDLSTFVDWVRGGMR